MRPSLSDRDVQVLRAVVNGYSRARIARELGISEAHVTMIVCGLLQTLARRTH